MGKSRHQRPIDAPVDDTAYERFVVELVDHPVTSPEWWWDPSTTTPRRTPERWLALLTRFFERSGALIPRFKPAQVGQALWYVFSTDCSNILLDAFRGKPKGDAQERAILAIKTLYTDVFAAHCAETIHHSITKGTTDRLGTTCYMLWDLAALSSPKCLDVMEFALSLPHITCKESALHGLGHWSHQHRVAVQRIIGEARNRGDIPGPLLDYARAAEIGMVQ